MSRVFANTSDANKDKHDLRIKFDRLVKKRKPNKRTLILKIFRELYPRIEEYIDQGMNVAEAREVFNEIAHSNVCVRTFNRMLSDARERSAKGNQGVTNNLSDASMATSASGSSACINSMAIEFSETTSNIDE